jgi:hypothetical protein
MTRSPDVAVPFEGDDVIDDYIAKYSNWGRWGADDELGTLNHVGPEQVVAAAQLVRQGKVIPSRCASLRWYKWACRSVRSGISKRSAMTAPATACTSSCFPRRRCPSQVLSVHRLIHWR